MADTSCGPWHFVISLNYLGVDDVQKILNSVRNEIKCTINFSKFMELGRKMLNGKFFDLIFSEIDFGR